MQKKIIRPQLSALHEYEKYYELLRVELKQAIEEGLDVGDYWDTFAAVAALPESENKAALADILYDITYNAETREDYGYDEPSDLAGIRALCRPVSLSGKCGDFADKLRGAWLGRICGCLLGKPVEGVHTDDLIPFLMKSGNFPMHRYILSGDVHPEDAPHYDFDFVGRCYADTVPCAPADDDTNYTVMGQLIIDKYGRDFTPWDVAHAWLELQPKKAYCTAERVAFRNFSAGIMPPDSAVYRNPYREWIGAQIRGDYYGYINPGNPSAAAEMAWRDASISHVKNGIYGEMFVSAMLAAAAVEDRPERIIRVGLGEVPTTSRLYELVEKVLEWHTQGVAQEECFRRIHILYDEHDQHDWCHTISNAMIVTASLLYGEGNFDRSICMAVQTGFDTDCNGATVGSILGMCGGTAAIGSEWTEPVHDRLDTSIFGMTCVSIDELVKKTLEHAGK